MEIETPEGEVGPGDYFVNAGDESSYSHSGAHASKGPIEDGFDISEQFYGASLSNGGESDEGDYTESDEEGPDAYKAGGYHPVRVGELYNDRYKVMSKLGWGHFSTVWLCEDLHGPRSQACYVAMKVQKSAVHYTEAAYDEIELLACARNNRLNISWKESEEAYERMGLSPPSYPDFTGVVSLCDYFEVIGPNGVHVCMVFETMGPNVLTLIKKFDFKGVPLHIVRTLATHCLVGLDYLHRICGIIHTDLKPENVLVCCPKGVPVSKTGVPLVPHKGRIDATGRHFPNIPPMTIPRPKPTKAVLAPSRLSRQQRRRLAKKKHEEAREKNILVDSMPYEPLKPSRSDPSLLTTYSDTAPPRARLYCHPRAVYDKASRIGRPARPQLPPTELCPIMANVFDHESVTYKIADLGNACWVERHFSEDIQTRQYRSPEVLVGVPYDCSADIWSLACMIFELVTGDYLFDPKASDEYPRDEDHLALMIELLGPLPAEMTTEGTKSSTFFNKKGQLRHIKQLKIWGLAQVLHQKYNVDKAEADQLAEFLLPMLTLDPKLRASAQELLAHSWLTHTEEFASARSSAPIIATV